MADISGVMDFDLDRHDSLTLSRSGVRLWIYLSLLLIVIVMLYNNYIILYIYLNNYLIYMSLIVKYKTRFML